MAKSKDPEVVSQVPVGSVEIASYHDFDDFVQDVPVIERGFNLPVDLEPDPER